MRLFFLALPLLCASGKDKKMKTLKEFDYDLWAIEEKGKKRYFARDKATGEEAVMTNEVMRS